ncbi:T9SS type A sorting domain-containing protein [Aestuariibaculum lutulentum]|uniref:T9SS type A sorting domain-containing protein n=1 Tax=Aestuariibaculum lutulentum TaxID=2920935 RepID=A0ABS9RHM5_9FLAO|nr:T9SS type A sorting domain-containing protein [Aestuariibaculum lutulentum]MCH4551704.1 T9SS type A sorting domain-containing protein [Aestuariibaculum lutulentum]
MKKKLLLSIFSISILSAVSQAQIKYWDFGAKELGTGYDNMMPVNYLNAFANYNRQLDWVDAGDNVVTNYADGVKYKAKVGFDLEDGESAESLYWKFGTNFSVYADYSGSARFQVTSKGSSPTPPGGTLLSGGSLYTKPQMMPDLDGSVDLVFKRDSNSDRILTVNTGVTRFDERTDMPDGMDGTLYPGCLQYTTPGEKRYNRSGGRGLLINLEAGQWVTVVGSGQYVDINGDGTQGFSTGYIKFETFGGTGTPVDIDDWGDGTGSATGPIDGSDTGDEAVRVMQFQAIDAGTYSLSNRGGTLRIYRVYLGKVDASLGAGLQTRIFENGVYARTLSTKDKVLKVSTDVQARGNRIYVSNVISKTEINIYSITGALIKSVSTKEDMDFSFRSGLYIATVKTAEGQKSVKLLVK